jgi:hypothetical protein
VDVPILSAEKSTKQEEYIRLLVCRTCKTIEELPPHDGRPQDDVLLQITVERHGENHVGLLYNVGALHWTSPTMRESIKEQITKGSSGLDAFGTNFYATRMTFHEDAMTCFTQHMRPKGQCPDFRNEKKRLSPGTNADRKELGLSPVEKGTGPRVYLCDFCPVRTYNATKSNEERGLYS